MINKAIPFEPFQSLEADMYGPVNHVKQKFMELEKVTKAARMANPTRNRLIVCAFEMQTTNEA